MEAPSIGDVVRLNRNQPESALHDGDMGVVCSTWYLPDAIYEIEFEPEDHSIPSRALILSDDFVVIDHARVTAIACR